MVCRHLSRWRRIPAGFFCAYALARLHCRFHACRIFLTARLSLVVGFRYDNAVVPRLRHSIAGYPSSSKIDAAIEGASEAGVPMKLNEFWSRATVEQTDRDGKRVSFSCWRGSPESEDDAHRSALAAATRIVQQLLGGNPPRHYYARLPLRERIIERMTNDQGELIAAVTQNAYGSLVLNTARAMFIDLDFPPSSLSQKTSNFFRSFTGKATPSPEAEMLERVEQFHRAHAGWSFRVYRTLAGLRVLVTHALFEPSAGDPRAVGIGGRRSLVYPPVLGPRLLPSPAHAQAMALRLQGQRHHMAEARRRRGAALREVATAISRTAIQVRHVSLLVPPWATSRRTPR